jgi:outer membrane protein assembly factor BamB
MRAADWPQWRGLNRDAKADFNAPQTWPNMLTQAWKITVGQGDASPALAGGRLYVFSREQDKEVTRCLDATDGRELWQDGYDAQAATGPAGRHPGPRSSPAVSDGKVITYGVRGTLSCLDASNGKVLWRKNDFAGAYPRFFTSASPLISGGRCIVQLGGEESGGIVAYDMATGEQQWKWTEDGTAYASPVLLTLNDTPIVVALTAGRIVGLDLASGTLAWEAPFPVSGRAYNAATPIVEGATVIVTGAGRGTKALKIEKTADGFSARELWTNPNLAVQFNTPVLRNGALYGLSQQNEFFCINAENGQTAWTAPIPADPSGGQSGRGRGGGFGSIVDAGSVLLALTPNSPLMVFEPSTTDFKQLASYKIADTPTFAHPVVSDRTIYIKDQDSVIRWDL